MTTPVNFEIAKLLKEKGFGDKTKSYNKDGKLVTVSLFIRKYHTENVYYPAPTITEVVMWLYEKHGIWIYIKRFCLVENKEAFDKLQPIIEFIPQIKYDITDLPIYNSPSEAYETAIEYTLKNLI